MKSVKIYRILMINNMGIFERFRKLMTLTLFFTRMMLRSKEALVLPMSLVWKVA